jgi:hypothetical protein
MSTTRFRRIALILLQPVLVSDGRMLRHDCCSESGIKRRQAEFADAKKQKAHLAAGLRGEKAPRPLRGGRQNSFLGRSLVRGAEISQAGKGTF